MEKTMNIPVIASQRALTALLCVTPAPTTAVVAGLSVRGDKWYGGDYAGTDAKRMRATDAQRHTAFADVPGSLTWSPPI